MANILTYPIFQDIILPFVLVFVLIFAILQKSKLLGDGVQQINAIISFVLAGIFVAGFSTQVAWLKQFSVFLVVAVFILFVFMLIYGFAYSGEKGFELAKGWKIFIAGVACVALIIAALLITDTWDRVFDFFSSSTAGSNVLFIIVIAVALGALLFSGKKGQGS